MTAALATCVLFFASGQWDNGNIRRAAHGYEPTRAEHAADNDAVQPIRGVEKYTGIRLKTMDHGAGRSGWLRTKRCCSVIRAATTPSVAVSNTVEIRALASAQSSLLPCR